MNINVETNPIEPQETPEGDGAGAATNSPPPQNSPPDLSATVSNSTDPHNDNQAGNGAAPPPVTPATSPTPLQPNLSEFCGGLHAMHSQLRRMFEGTGKVNGKSLSLPAEYDKAYLTKLVKYGVTDEDELAAAVMSRADNWAKTQGEGYARPLVQKVKLELQAAEVKKQEKADANFENALDETNFTVEAVHVLESDETRYEFTIKGKTFLMTAKQLTAGTKDFAAKYLNALQEIPQLPVARKGENPLWNMLVNGWLKSATKKQLEGNATDEAVRLRAVGKAKNAIMEGVDLAGLHDDAAFTDTAAGVRYFTADGILARVRPLDSKVTLRDVAQCLMDLGCSFHSGFMAGTKPLDVWSEKLPPAPTVTGAAAPAVEPVATTDPPPTEPPPDENDGTTEVSS